MNRPKMHVHCRTGFRSKSVVLFLAYVGWAVITPASGLADLVYTNNTSDLINVGSPDGSGLSTVVDLDTAFGSASYNPKGITTAGTSLYWIDSNTDRVYRSALNGSGAAQLIDLNTAFGTASYTPEGLTTDGTFLYWADGGTDAVYRSLLDGTSPMKIFDDPSSSPGADWIVSVTAVPEPSAFAVWGLVIGLGIVVQLGIRWWRPRKKA